MLIMPLHRFARVLCVVVVTAFFTVSMVPGRFVEHHASMDLALISTQHHGPHAEPSKPTDLLTTCRPGLDCMTNAISERPVKVPNVAVTGRPLHSDPFPSSEARWMPVTERPPPRV